MGQRLEAEKCSYKASSQETGGCICALRKNMQFRRLLATFSLIHSVLEMFGPRKRKKRAPSAQWTPDASDSKHQ